MNDNETQKILSDAEEVKAMLGGKGWSVIKAKLDEKILDLQNINNIDEANLAIDLKARIMATKLLFEWLKNDIYGVIEQTSELPQPQTEQFIERKK